MIPSGRLNMKTAISNLLTFITLMMALGSVLWLGYFSLQLIIPSLPLISVYQAWVLELSLWLFMLVIKATYNYLDNWL